jgi:hypothetical protein
VLIKGNHELFASIYLTGSLSERVYLTKDYGGKTTLEGLRKMSAEEIKEFKIFIDNLPLYYEIESPKVYFAICVNSKGHRYILIDRDVKTAEIEAMSFDWDNISIKGLEVNDKKVTVVIELVTQ